MKNCCQFVVKFAPRKVLDRINTGFIYPNFSQPGTYTVPIHAAADTEKEKCNFTGSTQIALDVLANGTVMMNKVTVKAASTAYADYEAYKADASKVTVTYGSGEKKVNLVEKGLVEITYPDEIAIGKNNVITVTAKEGKDYKLVYKNNINQGKATVSVVGINAYTGKKDIKFTIKKEELNWLAALTELFDNLF